MPQLLIAIALRIRFESIEEGEHKLLVNFVNVDGKHVIPTMHAKVNINFPQGQKSSSVNTVLYLQMLRFDQCGEFSIDLAIDGKKEASLPLYLREHVF